MDCSAMISTLVGGLITLLGGFLSNYQENYKQRKLAAAVLYYDLKSIEDYLKAENDHVNIRFFKEWQSAVSKCSFLEANYVKLLYKIYDSVYDYNYYYGEKEKEGPVKKSDISQFESLKNIMLCSCEDERNRQEYSVEYQELMTVLEKKQKAWFKRILQES